MKKVEHTSLNIAGILLLGTGIVVILYALLYNEFTLVFLDPNPPLGTHTVTLIRSQQFDFCSIGFVLVLISVLVKKIPRLEAFMKKDLVVNTLVFFLAAILPIYVIEMSIKPFYFGKTTIFMKDSELGWKFKPNTEGVWGGSKVSINGKGLPGPELQYDKTPGVTRILYLGDSVTFGCHLESYEEAFPYLVGGILGNRTGKKIETINSGVGGYSPWQEYIYLAKEGIKYQPDLVVVSFILNDVTEKFGLKKFGGFGEGFQLSQNSSSSFEWFLDKIGGIVYLTKRIGARLKFGGDIQKGAANEEALRVESLVYHPDRPEVRRGWKITLENLGKIFNFCKDKNIPILLAVFPFSFQFKNVDTMSLPQKIVCRYAVDNDIKYIDLLPVLSEKMKEQGKTLRDYFFDKSHLTALGNKVVSKTMADYIQKNELIP